MGLFDTKRFVAGSRSSKEETELTTRMIQGAGAIDKGVDFTDVTSAVKDEVTSMVSADTVVTDSEDDLLGI